MVPSNLIFEEFDPTIVAKILKRQREIKVRQLAQKQANGGRTNLDCRCAFILDDCLYDQSWTKNKLIRSLFMNGRHYEILFIITMQYPLGIPPNLRTNIDYVFILREPIYANRKRIWEQ